MSDKRINLTTCTDAELNEAVALAAGWRRHRSGTLWTSPTDDRGLQARFGPPHFATSLDALTPILPAWWEVKGMETRMSHAFDGSVEAGDYSQLYKAKGRSPARALCGAYLKSQGWEVDDG